MEVCRSFSYFEELSNSSNQCVQFKVDKGLRLRSRGRSPRHFLGHPSSLSWTPLVTFLGHPSSLSWTPLVTFLDTRYNTERIASLVGSRPPQQVAATYSRVLNHPETRRTYATWIFATATHRPRRLTPTPSLSAFYKDEPLQAAAAILDKATGGAITRLVELGDVTGKANELVSLLAPVGVVSPRVLIVGLGQPRPLGKQHGV